MSELPMIEDAELAGGRVRHRLGIVGKPGFAPVPHLLLLHQHTLGLTSTELNVFLHIFMHWQDASKFPFVHSATIAKRMNTTPRNVQRMVTSLKNKGMLLRVPGAKHKARKEYDLRPGLMKLEPQAREWLSVQEEKRRTSGRSAEEMFAGITGVV